MEEIKTVENDKYYEIKKKYLAQGMSFLGFKYMKFGFGADTIYGFENTPKFKTALLKFIELRNQLIS